jgi:hypothetical protein
MKLNYFRFPQINKYCEQPELLKFTVIADRFFCTIEIVSSGIGVIALLRTSIIFMNVIFAAILPIPQSIEWHS